METMNDSRVQKVNDKDGDTRSNQKRETGPRLGLDAIVTFFGRRIESSVRQTVRDNLTDLSEKFSDEEIRCAKENARKVVVKAEERANRALSFIDKNAPTGKSRTVFLPGSAKEVQTIAESIMAHWRDAGYGVQQMQFVHDGIPATLIQIRNCETPVGNILRKAVGMVSCATVTMTVAADGIQVEVVSGTWIEKVGGSDPYGFLPRPMLAMAAVGYYRRTEFLDRVFTDIQARIAGQGATPAPEEHDASPAKA